MTGEARLRVEDFADSEFFQWPTEWDSGRKILRALVSVFAGLAAVGCCFALVGTLQHDGYHQALLLGEWTAGLAMTGVFLASGIHPRRSSFSPPQHVDDPEHGKGIITNLRVWPKVLLSPMMLLLAVGMYQGRYALANGHRKRIPLFMVYPLIVVFAVAAVCLLVLILSRSRLRQGVALFPGGVTLEYGFWADFIPWESLEKVAATQTSSGNSRQTTNQLALWLKPGTQITSTRLLPGFRGTKLVKKLYRQFTVDYLATDPALVYHLCDFYLRNPDLRHELGSAAALARALG